MAQQIVNNKYQGETGLTSRTKINANFTELYAIVNALISTKDSQLFIPIAGQITFTVTNFAFTPAMDYEILVGGIDQRVNSSRIGQVITYNDAQEGQYIIIRIVYI